jgi:glycosyltransferase involved in cell wall biosynthesis
LSEQPILTVITVVRNAVDVIDGCIRSVLQQDIPSLEYIIIDGASTDGTLDVVRGYGTAISRLLTEPDEGLYDAMNKGLCLAQGRFVHFLNADDRYATPDTLRTLLPLLDPRCVCHAQMIYRLSDGSQRLLGEPFCRRRELQASRLPQPVLFVARALYEQIGAFDTRYRIAADYDMVLRLTQVFPTRFIAQPVTIMHAGGISFQRPDLAFAESMHIARRHGRNRLSSIWDFSVKHLKWRLSAMLPPRLLDIARRGVRTMKKIITSLLRRGGHP